MRFQELTDRQWDFIRSPLPPTAYTGRPRADNRMTVNGILYVLMSGCRWIDMPSRYGSPKTVWERHKKGSEKGIWKRILDSLVSHGYHMGLVKVDDLSVDSSTVSAKKGGRRLAMTATRRRKEAKYMLCSDAPTSLPITIDLGPGDEHESRRLFPLLRNVRIRGTRRPRNRPKCVYADNKYHTPLVMMYLTGRGILQLASRNE